MGRVALCIGAAMVTIAVIACIAMVLLDDGWTGSSDASNLIWDITGAPPASSSPAGDSA